MLITHRRSSRSIIPFTSILVTLTGTGGSLGQVPNSLMADTINEGKGFAVSPHSTLSKPVVCAYLYNPTEDEITLKYPFKDEIENQRLEPNLVIQGNGLPDGSFSLVYRFMQQQKVYYDGKAEIKVKNGWFEIEDKLQNRFPNAEAVSWDLLADGVSLLKGQSPFSWSRFHGKVRYLSGVWRSTYIDLIPLN